MTIDDAVRWVDANKWLFYKRFEIYGRYAPYGREDYQQDAYEAAIKAAICCQRNPDLDFKGIFWNKLKDAIARVTPFPNEQREKYKINKAARKAAQEAQKAARDNPSQLPPAVESQNVEIPTVETQPAKKKTYHSGGTSMSFPSNAWKDIDIASFKSKTYRPHNIENTYNSALKPKLTPKEQQVASLLLGFTPHGCTTEREAAVILGVSRDTIRTYFKRTLKKARKDNAGELAKGIREKGGRICNS